MAGQVTKEIKDEKGNIIGFEVVNPEIIPDIAVKPAKKKGK